ncbi:unnamed protein product [Rodentolepis nana]|uniref:Uncharacterized protein n=1 Tax=Rodentolepis nana TaxID=102285 RepID=A0A0R3TS16_RODNA|nr:unnamed protein product [Rodentolepis nana]
MRRDTDRSSCFPPPTTANNPPNIQPRLLVPIKDMENMVPFGNIGTNSSVVLDSVPCGMSQQISSAPSGICTTQTPNMIIQNSSLPGIIPRMDQQTSNLITNATIANFISKLASNISTSLMDRAVVNVTKSRAMNNPISSLEEIGELVSGLSILTNNLNASIANIIMPNNRISPTSNIQNIVPPTNSSSSFASDTLKSLLTKPSAQQLSGKENLPIVIDDDSGNGRNENIQTLKPVRNRTQRNQRRKGVSREEVKQFINRS